MEAIPSQHHHRESMPIDLPSLVTFLGGAVLSVLVSGRLKTLLTSEQQVILRDGVHTEGRITRIWRPPLIGSFPRLYFEYRPHGSEGPVACCHVDRRSFAEMQASLPAVGSKVGVRYLPASPQRAVIAKLLVQVPTRRN